MRIICFGVRDVEEKIFNDVNKKYNYELTFTKELLNHSNVNLIDGHNVVLLRANCIADEKNLTYMKNKGVEYCFTRTVGVNHIDIDAAKKLEIKTAYVPYYSPNAVSELALSMGLYMIRNLNLMADKMNKKDFLIDNNYFSKEVRNSTIGVIGTGRIGFETAKAWKSLGAQVLGYDIFPRSDAKGIIDYTSLNELLMKSDLITLHCPLIKGQNEEFINKDSIAMMKKGVILINAARGELINYNDLLSALEVQHIKSVCLDTLTNESEVFFKTHVKDLNNATYEKLLSLKPRVLITPHIGSFTDEAVKNMVEISFENLKEFIQTNSCKNIIK